MRDREAHEEVERHVAVLTDELKKTNSALEEKTRQLAELSACYEALVQEHTKSQEADRLQWAFWAID